MHSGIKIITIDVHKPVCCVGEEEPDGCVRVFYVEKVLNVI